jgi:hypothetical protein
MTRVPHQTHPRAPRNLQLPEQRSSAHIAAIRRLTKLLLGPKELHSFSTSVASSDSPRVTLVAASIGR